MSASRSELNCLWLFSLILSDSQENFLSFFLKKNSFRVHYNLRESIRASGITSSTSSFLNQTAFGFGFASE